MQDKESSSSSKKSINDRQINSLLGKIIRVYKNGDSLTMDFIAHRVNIEVSEENRIVSISEG